MRCISVLTNVADQLYYPCEHIAWAADAELIKVKSDKWWLFSTVLWGTSLLLGILRSEITLMHWVTCSSVTMNTGTEAYFQSIPQTPSCCFKYSLQVQNVY